MPARAFVCVWSSPEPDKEAQPCPLLASYHDPFRVGPPGGLIDPVLFLTSLRSMERQAEFILFRGDGVQVYRTESGARSLRVNILGSWIPPALGPSGWAVGAFPGLDG